MFSHVDNKYIYLFDGERVEFWIGDVFDYFLRSEQQLLVQERAGELCEAQ